MITGAVLTSVLTATTKSSACVRTGSSSALTGRHVRMLTSARLTPSVTSCVSTPQAHITAAARRGTGGQRPGAARTLTSVRRTEGDAHTGVSTPRAGRSARVPRVWSWQGE